MRRGRLAGAFGIVAWGLVSAAMVGVGGVAAQDEALSDEAYERAVRRLRSADAEARVAAAELLGRRGQRRRDAVVPLLRERLREDDDWRVRASSGRALGRLAARDAVPDLVRALRDPVVDVRVVAAAAIWRLPDPAAVPALLELLRDRDASARQWGALALGVIRDRRATRPLVTLLDDAEADVRTDAIRSLGRLRDPRAVSPLEAYARDDDHAMDERIEAINALSSLSGPEKNDALVRLIRHDEARIRARAVQALGRVGDALAIPALRERREAEDVRTVRAAIDRAIEAIRRRAEGGGESGGRPLELPPMD
ncbi:MAG TPA: HEAT repeat domain-containing protein [Sandaracinaceae bacterium LLY-WYZ-13_1]|nr:HEAT repeat domain-containing protein [Sandaracinaceae bacterium LLY-WYZ-13_1]